MMPRLHTFQPISTCNSANVDARVNELIWPYTNSWNQELLNQIFLKEDVDDSESIRISQTDCPDRLIWHHTKSGMFSVRSAYCLANNMDKRGSSCRSRISRIVLKAVDGTLSGAAGWQERSRRSCGVLQRRPFLLLRTSGGRSNGC